MQKYGQQEFTDELSIHVGEQDTAISTPVKSKTPKLKLSNSRKQIRDFHDYNPTKSTKKSEFKTWAQMSQRNEKPSCQEYYGDKRNNQTSTP